ncbi:MAG: two-component regulator propeller domain-containing protein, partial [Bacteroidota bacterium]
MNFNPALIRLQFLWMFAMLCVTATAQPGRHKEYGSTEGLPSSTVYQCIQDSLGFMWFGTNHGLSRFDGVSFQNFTTRDGLPSNDVVHLEAGPTGKVWIFTAGGLAYALTADPDTIFQVSGVRGSLYPTVAFRDSHLYYGSVIPSPYGPARRDTVLYRLDIHTGEFIEMRGKKGYIGGFVGNQMLLWQSDGLLLCEVRDSFFLASRTFPTNDPCTGLLIDSTQSATFKDGGKGPFVRLNLSSGQRDTLLEFDDKDDVVHIKTAISTQNWGTFATSRNAVFYEIDSANVIFSKYPHLQPEITINSAKEDREGNLWLATESEGLRFIPHYLLKVRPLHYQGEIYRQTITSIGEDAAGTVLWGTHEGDLFASRANGELILRPESSRPDCRYGPIRVIAPLTEDVLFVGGYGRYCGVWRRGELMARWISGSLKNGYLDGEGNLLLANATSLFSIAAASFAEIVPAEFGEKTGGLYKSLCAVPHRAYAIYASRSSDTLWFGADEGLFMTTRDSTVNLGAEIPGLSETISDIQRLADGTLVVGTNGNGLFFLHGDSHVQLTVKDGLPSNVCNRIRMLGNDVFVATNKGVAVIRDFQQSLPSQDIIHLDVRHGLPSREIHTIMVRDGHLYVGGKGGGSILDLSILNSLEKVVPEPRIVGVRIKERQSKLRAKYALAASENNVKIDFGGLCFAAQGQFKYAYRMKGVDADWVETEFRTAAYPSLPPGDRYVFEVKVRIGNRPWSAKTASLAFEVAPRLDQMLIFRLGLAGLLLAILVGVVIWNRRLIQRRAQKKALFESEKTNLERSALRGQLNPHFIFNALASIQYYISSHDEDAAHRYLS